MKRNNYCTIYLTRHGETHANAKRILQGQYESNLAQLNKNGKQQAQILGNQLKDIIFDKVFSSDLMRAQQTAKLISLNRKIIIETTEALREKTFGRFENKTNQELREHILTLEKEYNSLSDEEKHTFKYDKGMESNTEATQRLSLFIREISVAYPNKTILMVSHGAIMRAFLIVLGWGTYKSLPPGSLKNTAYIKLRCDGTDIFIDEVFGIEKAPNWV